MLIVNKTLTAPSKFSNYFILKYRCSQGKIMLCFESVCSKWMGMCLWILVLMAIIRCMIAMQHRRNSNRYKFKFKLKLVPTNLHSGFRKSLNKKCFLGSLDQ